MDSWAQILDVDRPLGFPSAAPPPSPALVALVSELLQHEPARRLGGQPTGTGTGAAAVRAHAFFNGVEWAEVDGGTFEMPPAQLLKDKAGVAASSVDEDVDGRTARIEADGAKPNIEGPGGGEESKGGDDHDHDHDHDDHDDDDEALMDPLSAGLHRFLKEKQASEGLAAADDPAAAPISAPGEGGEEGVGQEEEEEEALMDPLSAGLQRFLKEKQASEGLAAADTTPLQHQHYARSSSSVASSAADCQVDGFWDGPAWEDTVHAWDRGW